MDPPEGFLLNPTSQAAAGLGCTGHPRLRRHVGKRVLAPCLPGTALRGSPVALYGGCPLPAPPTEGAAGASVSLSERTVCVQARPPAPAPVPVGVQRGAPQGGPRRLQGAGGRVAQCGWGMQGQWRERKSLVSSPTSWASSGPGGSLGVGQDGPCGAPPPPWSCCAPCSEGPRHARSHPAGSLGAVLSWSVHLAP